MNRVFAYLMWGKCRFLFLCSWLFLCYGCDAEIVQYPVLFKSSLKLGTPYGICSHISRKGIQCEFDSKEKDLAMVSTIGGNYIRTDFDWGYCQSDKNAPISYLHHDKMMQIVDSQKIQMLGILSSPQPYEYDKWKTYVVEIANHYKANVRYWEVINEADRWHLKYPDFKPNDYIRIIRDAYSLIKKNNRKAKVLFTSISDLNGDFIEDVLRAGVSDCFDIMNFHFYVNNNTEPEYLFKYFEDCQKVLKKYNIRKPVWLTETGCTTAYGYADEETQAKRLPRVFLISFASGVEKVFWYKSRAAERSNHFEEHFGIWHKDYTPKPAFYVYKTLTRICPPKSTRPQIFRKGNVYFAIWVKPDGKKITAFWTSKGVERINLSSAPLKIIDYLGNEVDVCSSTILVSPAIQYCMGNFVF